MRDHARRNNLPLSKRPLPRLAPPEADRGLPSERE